MISLIQGILIVIPIRCAEVSTSGGFFKNEFICSKIKCSMSVK